MPPILIGFLAGTLLAALRAPLGVELMQVPALTASTAYGYRAAALAAVGIGLLAARPALGRPLASGRLLLGAVLGFAHRGLVWEADPVGLAAVAGAVFLAQVGADAIDGLRGRRRSPSRALGRGAAAAVVVLALLLASEPELPGAAVALGFLGVAAMAVVGRSPLFASPAGEGEDPLPAQDPAPEAPSRSPGGLSGLALIGAGLALGLEGLARPLRLLTGGLAQDEALLGGLLLLLAAVGAGAFLQVAGGRRAGELGPALGLGASALAAFAGLRALAHVSSPRGLDRYLRGVEDRLPGVEVGLADHGTLVYDLVLAAPVLALPAVLLGAGLRACRRPEQLAALLFGAAIGTVLVPRFVDFRFEPAAMELVDLGPTGASAGLIPIGAKLAALGALLAIALGTRLAGLAPKLATLAALGLGAAAFLLPAPTVLIAAPWQKRPVLPTLVLDTPEGLLTVEPTGGGIEAVTLDRRYLSPPFEEAGLDRALIEAAFRALPAQVQGGGALRVLLLGQLTPGRALAMQQLGAERIDRTGSWHRAMPELEAALFTGTAPPPGEVLAPGTARARLAEGEYDLLLVPPVPGDPPTTRALGWPLPAEGSAEADAEPPRDTTAVLWLDTRSPIAHLALGPRVLPATAGLQDLAVGIAYSRGDRPGAAAVDRDGSALAAGEPLSRPDPIDRLRNRTEERRRENRRDLARRLAGAAQQGAAVPLTAALARYFDGQRRSSGFERPADQIELPIEALELFREAGIAHGELSPFLRETIEAVARILRGKRWVEEIHTYLAPIEERHSPWPVLAMTLAYADLELLDPEGAAERLRELLPYAPGDVELWWMLGEAEAQSGATREAVESFRKALELDPEDHELERRLAIQLVLAGDPEGAERIRGLLLEDPEDEALRAYLGPGPYPELPQGYPLTGNRHAH